MSKFEIEYYITKTCKKQVEAKHDYGALEKFREDHKYEGVKSIKYVYEGNEEPKEYYCSWWDGNDWKSKVVLAHNEDEIKYNIKETLGHCVYDFMYCLNTREAIDGLMRARWD